MCREMAAYEQVKDQLQQELQTKLSIDAHGCERAGDDGDCPAEPVLGTGRLPVRYALTPTSTRPGCWTRSLTSAEPENDAIIDQLVESIMSYEVFYYWEDPEPEQRRRNPLLCRASGRLARRAVSSS